MLLFFQIYPSLQAHPGINPESLKVVDIISAIHGLSDSFTENDYFGHGPLSEIMDAQDFINNLKDIYTKKIMSRIQDSKFDKAESPRAIDKAAETKKKLEDGLKIVMGML